LSIDGKEAFMKYGKLIRSTLRLSTVTVGLVIVLTWCTGTGDSSPFRAPDLSGGKADSYINSAAKEYGLVGTAHFGKPAGLDEMTPEDAQKALEEAADSKLQSVANAIHSFLRDRASTLNAEIPHELPEEIAEQIKDEDDATKSRILDNWRTQQEVSAFLRVSGHHYDSIRPDEGELYAFDFEVEAVLSSKLVIAIFEEGGGDIEVTVTSWSSEPREETIKVTGVPTPSFDAYPRYDALFEDGVFDIAVHVGGDYNEEEVEVCCPDPETGETTCRDEECANTCEVVENVCNTPPEGCTVTYKGGRVDRETAKGLVEYLLADGFQHTAATYKDLTIDSPSFTKTVQMGGSPLEIRFKVVYPEIVPCGEEDKLIQSMRDSLASMDMIVYAGHAGPGAGFILDYQPRAELDDRDWPSLTMPDKYQIVLMYGCRTYATYADALYANPAKNDANLDVVTTVNTMWTNMGLPGTLTVFTSMLFQDDLGRHVPVSWINLLNWLNLQDQNAHTHYGVHGVDSDPKISPWAGPESLCRPCETNTDCGGGGSFCFDMSSGGKSCLSTCTADEGCGAGYLCLAVPGLEDTVVPRFCLPATDGCP
jgi:hypothetical protein